MAARRVLTTRHRNRALLDRQLLLTRAILPLAEAVERMGAVQDQNATSLYVGLWSRVEGVTREAVTRALEDRVLVQGTLMRSTIHVVAREAYWRYAAGVGEARRAWWLAIQPAAERAAAEARQTATAEALRAALADGPRSVKELGSLATGFVGAVGLWVDLVRVPPSGTWDRRRADRLALAEDWVGPCDASRDAGLVHLVRTYLAAFGPATWKDVASWSGVPVPDLQAAGASLDLVTHEDEAGRPLVDLRGGPLPDPDVPAPVRFLPHWDALTLAHARGAGAMPEPHRSIVFSTKNPASVGTVLVDGRVVAGWRLRDGEVMLEPFEPIAPADLEAIAAEQAALQAFVD